MVDDLDFARHRLASMEELGTLQNLGRDDLDGFSTIKDPFGLETKSCSKSSRPIVLNVEAGLETKSCSKSSRPIFANVAERRTDVLGASRG